MAKVKKGALMEAKQLPRSERLAPIRKLVQWKTVGVAILLICALAALVLILVFHLYVSHGSRKFGCEPKILIH